jgi:branched-chain amino acid transport system permease protein
MTPRASTLADWRKPLALAAAAAVVLCALAPLVSDYGIHVLNTSLYYTILAASWNLLAGFTGRFSLAHQAFAALGAYTSGLLAHYYDTPLWLGIPAGVAVATLLGFALGRMVLRMRAIYLAIATWAFAETVHILLTAAYSITRGELGLTVPPIFADLNPRSYFYLFVALTIACVLAMYAIVRSPIGYFMRAIKDDELRAESLGVDTTRIKVFVFTVSSAFAGLAGAFYGHYVVVLSPQIADFSEMAKLIVMVVVGGFGSFAGPLVGAAPIQILNAYLAKYGEWDMVIFAVVVIVFMRAHMGGLADLARVGWCRLVRRPA